MKNKNYLWLGCLLDRATLPDLIIELLGSTYCRDVRMMCQNKNNPDGFICTREAGHYGPHIACGDLEDPLAIWNDYA